MPLNEPKDQIEALFREVETHAITQLEMVRPCPFCHAGPPLLRRIHDGWCLQCPKIECVFGRSNKFLDLRELLDKWNRRYERSLPPPPDFPYGEAT